MKTHNKLLKHSLDFNGAFQFSKLGDKGIILQLQQILWTIFRNNPSQIRYVSFLIEGKSNYFHFWCFYFQQNTCEVLSHY